MPNYALVIDSKFKPFSFQDMLAPVTMAQAKHEQLEQQYGELLGDAEEWGSKIDRVNDPIAYARYKSFMDNLNANSGELSRHGLNRNSTKSLMNTRSYYRNRIKPIEEAWTTRKEQQAKFRDMITQNPTLLYENNIMNASLDDYLNNPAYDWGKSYSGALITQQVADQLAPIAKALNNYGRGKSLDPFLITISKNYGITVDEARRLIQEFHDDPQSAIKESNIVSQIIKNTIDSTQVDSWNPAVRDAVKQRMYEYAGMAIPHAIGVGDVQFTPNQGAIMAQQHEYAKKLAGQRGGNDDKKPKDVGKVGTIESNNYTSNDEEKKLPINKVYSYPVKNGRDLSLMTRSGKFYPIINNNGYIKYDTENPVEYENINNGVITGYNVYNSKAKNKEGIDYRNMVMTMTVKDSNNKQYEFYVSPNVGDRGIYEAIIANTITLNNIDQILNQNGTPHEPKKIKNERGDVVRYETDNVGKILYTTEPLSKESLKDLEEAQKILKSDIAGAYNDYNRTNNISDNKINQTYSQFNLPWYYNPYVSDKDDNNN